MKQPEWIKNLPRSIFIRIQMSFIATAVLIAAIVFGMVAHFSKVHDLAYITRNHNRIYYATLLAEQISNPPNLLTAQELVSKLNIKLRIEGNGVNYASTPEIPSAHDLEASGRQCTWNKEARGGIYGGNIYTMITRGGVNYIISHEPDNFLSERPAWGPLLIALVLFALLLNYMMIRWLFKPLRWLSEGVQQFKTSHLPKPIPTRENDELGDLAKSFNQMTEQVSEMLKSKEQLLLDVSHELRSPLTRIKVALELDEGDSKDQIKKNVRELEIMISELLESARLDTPQGGLKLTRVSIKSLVEKVVSHLQAVNPGIILTPISEDLVEAVDSVRVEMVLKNVLENGLKYSSHQDKPVEVEVYAENGKLTIGVRDHGFGIPEEEQIRVFEPFYRIDKSRVRETGGYGLGLSLCKKIMTAHEGSIKVESSSDLGTLFTLDFKAT